MAMPSEKRLRLAPPPPKAPPREDQLYDLGSLRCVEIGEPLLFYLGSGDIHLGSGGHTLQAPPREDQLYDLGSLRCVEIGEPYIITFGLGGYLFHLGSGGLIFSFGFWGFGRISLAGGIACIALVAPFSSRQTRAASNDASHLHSRRWTRPNDATATALPTPSFLRAPPNRTWRRRKSPSKSSSSTTSNKFGRLSNDGEGGGMGTVVDVDGRRERSFFPPPPLLHQPPPSLTAPDTITSPDLASPTLTFTFVDDGAVPVSAPADTDAVARRWGSTRPLATHPVNAIAPMRPEETRGREKGRLSTPDELEGLLESDLDVDRVPMHEPWEGAEDGELEEGQGDYALAFDLRAGPGRRRAVCCRDVRRRGWEETKQRPTHPTFAQAPEIRCLDSPSRLASPHPEDKTGNHSLSSQSTGLPSRSSTTPRPCPPDTTSRHADPRRRFGATGMKVKSKDGDGGDGKDHHRNHHYPVQRRERRPEGTRGREKDPFSHHHHHRSESRPTTRAFVFPTSASSPSTTTIPNRVYHHPVQRRERRLLNRKCNRANTSGGRKERGGGNWTGNPRRVPEVWRWSFWNSRGPAVWLVGLDADARRTTFPTVRGCTEPTDSKHWDWRPIYAPFPRQHIAPNMPNDAGPLDDARKFGSPPATSSRIQRTSPSRPTVPGQDRAPVIANPEVAKRWKEWKGKAIVSTLLCIMYIVIQEYNRMHFSLLPQEVVSGSMGPITVSPSKEASRSHICSVAMSDSDHGLGAEKLFQARVNWPEVNLRFEPLRCLPYARANWPLLKGLEDGPTSPLETESGPAGTAIETGDGPAGVGAKLMVEGQNLKARGGSNRKGAKKVEVGRERRAFDKGGRFTYQRELRRPSCGVGPRARVFDRRSCSSQLART
ncbi:hypothetical protein DFP72DRAFT_853928 [Ephemerocybe angulata]|uniref:Uncharacterized protein n=1 Tax=Ephemerocybe angulata TaxID=980116 RepID=A0A8H6HLE8_9AGAR|nr:hypothetical protein DFP72DRAFT_853928 [Tulosesus angulatus]